MLSDLRLATAKVFEDVYAASSGETNKMADWATFYAMEAQYDPGSGSTTYVLTPIGQPTIVVYSDGSKTDEPETNVSVKVHTILVQQRDIPYTSLKAGYVVEIGSEQYEIVSIGAPNPVAYEVEVRPWKSA